MAVALATLPLNRRLAGDGDAFLISATGAGLATAFAEVFAGLVAGAVLPAGFAGVLVATGLVGFLLLAATFFAATFGDGAFWTAAFLGAAFFGCAAFFAAGACFGELFLTTTFFETGCFTAAFFAGTGFFDGACFFAAGLATALTFAALLVGLATAFFAGTGFADFAEWPDFAGALLTFFTAVPFADAAFDAAVLRLFD